ncbi:hypothetical protein AV530_000022 [Patagioenas fasciata monilis]|uniref:Uncharacterized protein n=1 Tax=Patagioenas fasciata monilis TaxID=372326 RepID=A0A1V4K397_PATFA|nr:hypothetical protein AV530_000022 [Patagioenas fasciata monilis]
MTGNKEDFYRHIISKVKSKENANLLLNGAGEMVTKDTGKAKVFNVFFTSIFTSKTGLQDSQASETSEKVWSKENSPPVEENQVINVP